MEKGVLKTALRDTVPVLTGYLVLGMGFGIIMNTSGYGIILPVVMSLFIFAGSMQYAAVGLLTGGASLITVALTTLAVNARHLFYGVSMLEKYKNCGIKKPYLIFSLTDETYSLVCSSDKGADYFLLVSAFDHFYWVAGTALGAVLGTAVKFNTEGIDFALTALFITVFVDQWLKAENHFSAITGVLATLACLLIFGAQSFLIPSMVIITAVLLIKGRGQLK